jgi:hypothetical protein
MTHDSMADLLPESSYYVMLGWNGTAPAGLAGLSRDLAALTGGIAEPDHHVTVAYLRSRAPATLVADLLSEITGPPVTLKTSGPISLSERANPVFGHAAFLAVERTEALHQWHRLAGAAAAELGLDLAWSWSDSSPHLRLVTEMARSLSGFEPGLFDGFDFGQTLAPTHLSVSSQTNGSFSVLLSRELAPASAVTRVGRR